MTGILKSYTSEIGVVYLRHCHDYYAVAKENVLEIGFNGFSNGHCGHNEQFTGLMRLIYRIYQKGLTNGKESL
jgi:hypothetical protein